MEIYCATSRGPLAYETSTFSFAIQRRQKPAGQTKIISGVLRQIIHQESECLPLNAFTFPLRADANKKDYEKLRNHLITPE